MTQESQLILIAMCAEITVCAVFSSTTADLKIVENTSKIHFTVRWAYVMVGRGTALLVLSCKPILQRGRDHAFEPSVNRVTVCESTNSTKVHSRGIFDNFSIFSVFLQFTIEKIVVLKRIRICELNKKNTMSL